MRLSRREAWRGRGGGRRGGDGQAPASGQSKPRWESRAASGGEGRYRALQGPVLGFIKTGLSACRWTASAQPLPPLLPCPAPALPACPHQPSWPAAARFLLSHCPPLQWRLPRPSPLHPPACSLLSLRSSLPASAASSCITRMTFSSPTLISARIQAFARRESPSRRYLCPFSYSSVASLCFPFLLYFLPSLGSPWLDLALLSSPRTTLSSVPFPFMSRFVLSLPPHPLASPPPHSSLASPHPALRLHLPLHKYTLYD